MSYYLTETGASSGTSTIVVGGELDASAAPAFREALGRAIDAGVGQVNIDLTDTTFVDSTAIGALLSASQRIYAAGGGLQVICTNPNVLAIFEIAGIEHQIPVSRQAVRV